VQLHIRDVSALLVCCLSDRSPIYHQTCYMLSL
jgi:hypothetical protein